MNWFEKLYNNYINVNFADYENIGLNMPISKLLFFLTVGLCAAIIIIGNRQRVVALVLKKLIRRDCYGEGKALTLKELGLSNSAAAKKLLVSSNAYLKKTVLRVGEKQLSYEEYEALIKAEKESKAKGKKTATAATSTAEVKTVSEFYSFDINEAKFYIAEDKRDYASRLLGINDVTVTKTVLGCVLVFGFYLILLFAIPTLLSWINAVLA